MKTLLVAILALSFPVMAQDGTITFTGAIVSSDGPHTVTYTGVSAPSGSLLLDYYVTQDHGSQVAVVTYK